MKETQDNLNLDTTSGIGGDQESAKPGTITRRTYLHRSLMGGAALAGGTFFDTLTSMNVAIGLAWRRHFPRQSTLRMLAEMIRDCLPPEVQALGERGLRDDRNDSREPAPREMVPRAVGVL